MRCGGKGERGKRCDKRVVPTGSPITAASSSPASYVYVVRSEDEKLLKIGQTRTPAKRLKTLQATSPGKLTFVGGFEGGPAGAAYHEAMLHARFRDERVHGEWFNATILDELRPELTMTADDLLTV